MPILLLLLGIGTVGLFAGMKKSAPPLRTGPGLAASGPRAYGILLEGPASFTSIRAAVAGGLFSALGLNPSLVIDAAIDSPAPGSNALSVATTETIPQSIVGRTIIVQGVPLKVASLVLLPIDIAGKLSGKYEGQS